MQVRVSKWGNSLAVRLPRAIAEQLRLADGQCVELEAKDGLLELRPVTRPLYRKYDRDELIGQIDPEGVPDSFDDPPRGSEFL